MKNIIEEFINEIIYIRKSLDLNDEEILVESSEVYSVINGLSYRLNNPRIIGLGKKMATMLYNQSYSDYDDICQELILCLILALVQVEDRDEYSIEEGIRLLLLADNSSREEIIKAQKFYRLMETKVKQHLANISNYRKRKASTEIHGREIKVISFGELINEETEESVEDFIDRVNINNNIGSSSEDNDEVLIKWIEDNKVSFTKGERSYLNNPLKHTPASRTYHHKNLERKLYDKAIKEFGTTEEKVVKDIISYKVLEKVLDADNFQQELVNNIDILEELIYTNIDSFEVLKDITASINDVNHICSNSNLIVISKLLWKEFNKFQDKITNVYKVKNEEKFKKLKKQRFNIHLIENIDTSDNDVYKKRINGRNTQTWERFRNMHKKAYEAGKSLQGDFLSYIGFCKWLEENNMNGVSKIYHSDESNLSTINSYILPVGIISFLSPVSILYDKADGIYKGKFVWKGKETSFYSTEKLDELEMRIKKAKKAKLKEIADSIRSEIAPRAYEFLVNYKY